MTRRNEIKANNANDKDVSHVIGASVTFPNSVHI